MTEDKDYIKYTDVLECLRYGVDNDLNVSETTTHFGKNERWFYDYFRRNALTSLKKGTLSDEQFNELGELYERLKENNGKPSKPVSAMESTTAGKVDLDEEIEDDAHVYGISVRDENNKITHYKYAIRSRHNELIEGEISRDLMNDIFSLYTREAGNLTQRTVARELLNELNVDFFAFQKILKVFEITKASIPVAFHVLEENDLETITEQVFREKEKLFFKKLEQERYKKLEQKYLTLFEENKRLSGNIKNATEVIEKLDLSKVIPFNVENLPKKSSDRALVVYLSDCHFGSLVDNNETLYYNDYSIPEVERRFNVIFDNILELSRTFNVFDRIMIINMGDILDGDKNQTSRGGHFLPQYLNGRRQFNFAVKLLQSFVHSLYENNVAKHIDYFSVSTGNHDGTLGYATSRLLQEYFKVKYPGMIASTFERFIDFVVYGKHILLLSHGKDAIDMNKSYPLILNDQYENRINEYIDYNLRDIATPDKNIIFVKGDTHTSATTYGKKFEYRSVGSVLGSTLWTQLNFGNSLPVCEYSILDRDDSKFQLNGRIILS